MVAFIIVYLSIAGACLISLGLSDSYGAKYSYVRTLGIAAIWPVSVPYILMKKHRRSQDAS